MFIKESCNYTEDNCFRFDYLEEISHLGVLT